MKVIDSSTAFEPPRILSRIGQNEFQWMHLVGVLHSEHDERSQEKNERSNEQQYRYGHGRMHKYAQRIENPTSAYGIVDYLLKMFFESAMQFHELLAIDEEADHL